MEECQYAYLEQWAFYRLVYALLTLSAGGATGLDLPDVVLSYSVEIEGLGYVVGSHG